jgi:hypothetical protein
MGSPVLRSRECPVLGKARVPFCPFLGRAEDLGRVALSRNDRNVLFQEKQEFPVLH